MAATPPSTSLRLPRRWRRVLGCAVLVAVGLWLTFFDSHSLLRRVRWHQELRQLTHENARLEARIQELDAQLDAGLPDEVVERIAREEYGMRRPGETVYRTEP